MANDTRARTEAEERAEQVSEIGHLTQRPRRQRKANLGDIYALEARISELEGVIADMKKVIRTQRLVVEEQDGFERVVIEGEGECGGVTVHARSPLGEGLYDNTTVTMRAVDLAVGQEAAYVGLAAAGNTVALFEVERLPDLDQPGVDPDVREQWRAGVSLDAPTAVGGGIELDADGLRLSPTRLYYERRALEQRNTDCTAERRRIGTPCPPERPA
jgi:hypothetical protein